MTDQSIVLVVDDEVRLRKTLQALLKLEGYHLAFATNGAEALAQAEALMPDVILLDVMMPDMDGIEVCRRLRAHPHLAEVPIIIVTALDDKESRLQAIEAGADDFISKPFDSIELKARVRAITRLNRYHRLLLERTYRQEAEEEIERRNYELTLLNHVLTAAAANLDIRDLLLIGCEALARAFNLPQAIGGLLNEEQSEFIDTIGFHAPETSFEASGDDIQDEIPLVGYCTSKDLWNNKTPAVVTEKQIEIQLPQIRDLMNQFGVGALVVVPLVIRNSLAGIIELKTAEQVEFSPQEISLAQSIATAISQAIESAELYQNLQNYARDLETTVKQRTQELQNERDYIKAILETSGESIIVIDINGVIRYANPATEELTGYDYKLLVGQPWSLWHGDQHQQFYLNLQQIIDRGQMWRGEVVNQRKDGTYYDAALTIAPLFDSSDPTQPLGFVSVQRDVTPLKEADRIKSQFISNTSHELRTPLSTITLISGNLDTLYDRLDNKKRRKLIRDIRKHARILNELVNNVLEIARFDDGRIVLDYQPVDLVEVTKDVVNQQLPLAQEKSQIVKLSGDKHLNVWGDNNKLQQVIRNLLNNAIKYTPDGGKIVCECREYHKNSRNDEPTWPGSKELPEGDWAAIKVIDTGVGISQEHLSKLFERFYRVNPQSETIGTGLGLSIARDLVSLHNGHIAVASSRGKETAFAVYLPLLKEGGKSYGDNRIYSGS